MGKNQYTEIDKLFRSKLGSEAVSPGAWNEPTDDMFLAAMEQVNKPPEKSNKRRRLFWPFLLIPFVGLLGVTISNALKVDELRSTISEMKSSELVSSTPLVSIAENNRTKEITNETILSNYTETQHNNNDKLASTNNKAVKSKSTLLVGQSNNSSNFKSIDNNIVPPTYINKATATNNAGPAENMTFPLFSTKEDLSIEKSNTKPSLVKVTPNKELLGMNLLPGKNGLLNIVERNAIALSLETDPFVKETVEAKNNKFALFAFMNINLNTLRISGLETNGYSLTDFDKSYVGYEYGVGALQNINNRFGISYSLSHSEVINHSLFEGQTMFDESNMSVGTNGETSYLLDTEVETPMGAFSLRQSVPMSDVQIQDQTMMDQTTNIRQSLKFISLGIQPRVNLWSNNNLSLFAEAGVNVNYLVSFDQDLEIEMHHGGNMMMQKSMYDNSMTTLNRLTLAASAGIGVNYSFGEHLFSSIRLGGSRSLNPISQQNNTGGDINTYIDNLGVSISAGYKF